MVLRGILRYSDLEWIKMRSSEIFRASVGDEKRFEMMEVLPFGWLQLACPTSRKAAGWK